MAGLALYFLGSPRLERDGAVVQVDTRKAVALLAYLAVTRHEHGRDTLAALLWPEYDQQHARGALRRTLSALRGALGGEWLAVTQEGIGLNWDAGPWIDVDQFTRLATIGRSGASAPVGGRASLDDAALMAELAAAAELYRDDFLAGFSLRDSAAFDDWQFMQSEGLRRDFATLLERLVRGFAALGAAEQAIVYARRWLALDPLEEPVHRILMQLYAATGQRSSALRQYQECVRILQQELGVAPLGETTLLYQQIKEQRPGAVLAPVLRAAGGPAASASAGDTAPP